MYAMLKKNIDGACVDGPPVSLCPKHRELRSAVAASRNLNFHQKSWVIRNPRARNVCHEFSHFQLQNGRPQVRISSTKQLL
jgi:hypothetical protein